MLIPKKSKFRKPHKGKLRQAQKGNYVAFGEFGLTVSSSF